MYLRVVHMSNTQSDLVLDDEGTRFVVAGVSGSFYRMASLDLPCLMATMDNENGVIMYHKDALWLYVEHHEVTDIYINYQLQLWGEATFFKKFYAVPVCIYNEAGFYLSYDKKDESVAFRKNFRTLVWGWRLCFSGEDG